MRRASSSPRIYLSYRRRDFAYVALTIYQRLAQHYPDGSVVFDVNTLPLGRDLAQALRDQVRTADLVLALIGPRWLAEGHLEESDWIRIELAEALEAGITVIPVLVEEGTMPSAEQLPPDLRALANLQAVRVSQERLDRDVAGLISTIDLLVEPSRQTVAKKRRAPGDERQEPAFARRQRKKEVSRVDVESAELENWEAIRESGSSDDLRDHIARYPGGRTEDWARARLAQVVWEELGGAAERDDLSNYVAEFPFGSNALEARRQLQELDGQPEVVAVPRGGVFISYRRDDARLWALLLHASIAQRIGSDRVFLDTRNIPFGQDYADYIRRELPGYGIAVVLLGQNWRGEREDGPPRIEDPDDLFRIELELAMAHGLTILPVTLDGLNPPHDESLLPASIRGIGKLNMYGISARKFEEDSPRLLSAIEEHHERALVDANPEEYGAFIAGAGLGVDNRTLLGNVDRLLETKLDRAIRRFTAGALAIGVAVAAVIIGAVWVLTRA